MEQKKLRMQELVELLNKASKAYYQDAAEIMSNFEYDKLYDELLALEQELGITMANSPTVNVGYEVLSELPKERHEKPMLSLDKTKEVSRLKEFLGQQKAFLSWKLDGLTIVLTYQNGKLEKAVTRGNGEIGEVITNNAKTFKNLPLKIAYQGELILRGEAIISYSDFEKINAEIEDVEAKYKNPRNLCSGSVRQLNNEITAKRNVKFFAFSLVKAEDVDFENSRINQLKWLKEQGFEVVEGYEVTADIIEEKVAYFAEQISKNDFPSDGLVLVYDDIAYGQSLGMTSKFPRDSFAFKWADEIRETKLLEIEWSASRTGLLNPVAIFEPVELEGTTVSRASVHNISIMEELELGIGDKIEVYKANMIIPQISENLTRSGTYELPKYCPSCGEKLTVKISVGGVKDLYCPNTECIARNANKVARFCDKDAMNIDGLSAATVEKMIAHGWIGNYKDLYHLQIHADSIVSTPGFGPDRYNYIIEQIEKSRKCLMYRFLVGIGIPLLGPEVAKKLHQYFYGSMEEFENAIKDEYRFSRIEGISDSVNRAIYEWYEKRGNRNMLHALMAELEFIGVQKQEEGNTNPFLTKNIVVTGTFEHFDRQGLLNLLDSLGAITHNTVSTDTDFLIYGSLPGSKKVAKAIENGVTMVNEQSFVEMLEQNR